MKRMTTEERVRIASMLVEGNSLRAVSRMAGCSVNTVMKFVVDLGNACQDYHDAAVRGLRSERLQCDEIWAFCRMKQKRVPQELKGTPGLGDVWTWTVIDADSKLMVSWLVGPRDSQSAAEVLHDAAGRIVSERVQITSDGYRFYGKAVADAFGDSVDYAEISKVYGGADGSNNARYSPAICIGCVRKRVIGNPDQAHISTSYVERQNLTMRMGMRRYTRLTNGFSKKLDNHCAALAIHFMHYNFCRVHKTLKTTPAVCAGIADHVWSLEELVGILEAEERAIIGTESNKRGPYRKVKNSN